MPEKMVIQCREKGQNILDRVNYVKEEIAKYVGDKPSSNNNTDTNKNDDSNEKPDNEARDADELTPVLYGPAPVPTATFNPIQPVLYGPAPVPTATFNPIQPVLYGPAPVPTATLNPIQPVLYGPAPVPNDNEPIVIPLPSVIPTPSVAPTPQQDSDQQYKIYNPIGGQGSSDESVNPYTAVPDTNPNVEYSSIPDTAVGMDFDIDKLKAPLAAGLAGGVLSLEAARRARRNSSDDEEELEEFEEEKK